MTMLLPIIPLLSADPTDIAKPKLITTRSWQQRGPSMNKGRMIFYAYPPPLQHTTLRTPPQAGQLSDMLAVATDLVSATLASADEPGQSHNFGSHAPIRIGMYGIVKTPEAASERTFSGVQASCRVSQPCMSSF